MGRLRKSREGAPSDGPRFDAIIRDSPNQNGLKTLRELALFQFSCRRCAEAPCVMACPAQALEKDADGILHRSTHLCVACKSCVVICPFGTIMNDLFEHIRTDGRYFDLDEPDELQRFLELNPDSRVSLIGTDTSPKQDVHTLREGILIKEYTWEKHKNPEK